ncbi:Non-specific acid phosphatase [Gammaproteobacteria bacterium]
MRWFDPIPQFFLLIAVGCFGVMFSNPSVAESKSNPEILTGYLSEKDLSDSIALIPPPPLQSSAFFTADQEAYRLTRKFRDTPRWALAAEDANLAFPEVVGTFSCALGAPITEKTTQHLYQLMHRTRIDISHAIQKMKIHYQRIRPFVVNKEVSCTPQDEPMLTRNGSFPSGHTATGWMWAMILTEIAPDHTDAILARGYAFGHSRVVCGVHWQSDVDAGRIIADSVVARLHANPTFRTHLEIAKVELAATRAKGLKPTRNCQAEAEALSFQVPSIP